MAAGRAPILGVNPHRTLRREEEGRKIYSLRELLILMDHVLESDLIAW
jgi:hypothetical protein